MTWKGFPSPQWTLQWFHRQWFCHATLEHAAQTFTELYGFQPTRDLYRAFLPGVSYPWRSNCVRSALGDTNLDMLRDGLDTDALENCQAKALGIFHCLPSTVCTATATGTAAPRHPGKSPSPPPCTAERRALNWFRSW